MDNDVVISVENVTMAFNLNKEKVDNLKEYVIKLLRRQLEFKKFYALQDITSRCAGASIWAFWA